MAGTPKELDLSVLLPSVHQSMDGIGFLFGAGTSKGAGYPLMVQLTKEVIGALSPLSRSVLQKVLASSGVVYDENRGDPNIETLSDLVIAHAINANDSGCSTLESEIRQLIVDRILSVNSPVIETHVAFLTALKQRSFGRPCTIWIYTTNYDLLFELAAAEAGVSIENGFCGTVERYYDPQCFGIVRGRPSGNKFVTEPQLTIKLVKLHGSISWFHDKSRVFERHPSAMAPDSVRAIVLPRRRKIMETLNAPFDSLFRYASQTLGSQCRYLLSCGFSFGDNHINEHLLLPALTAKKCRLFALCADEPGGLDAFKRVPTFSAAFSSSAFIGGNYLDSGTQLWNFSALTRAFS